MFRVQIQENTSKEGWRREIILKKNNLYVTLKLSELLKN